MGNFSERLVELRTEKGLSQVRLAKEIGFSRSVLGYWEKGTKIPNANAIIVLAKYFDVTSDYLLGLSDDAERM